jgi:hypothetical protein
MHLKSRLFSPVFKQQPTIQLRDWKLNGISGYRTENQAMV